VSATDSQYIIYIENWFTGNARSVETSGSPSLKSVGKDSPELREI